MLNFFLWRLNMSLINLYDARGSGGAKHFGPSAGSGAPARVHSVRPKHRCHGEDRKGEYNIEEHLFYSQFYF